MNVNEILLIFCQYGFRKASMEDIARAAGLSRQSIYKKFQSKEGVFEWAINEAGKQAYDAAMNALKLEDVTPEERIIQAYDRWVGEFIPTLRATPHGGEMLDMAMKVYGKSGETREEDFYNAIEQVLLDAGIASDADDAADKGFTMTVSSKGLLLRAVSQEEFRDGMSRVLRAIKAG